MEEDIYVKPGEPDHHIIKHQVLRVDVGGGKSLQFRIMATCWKCVQRSGGEHPPSVISETTDLGLNEETGEVGHAFIAVCPSCLHRHSVSYFFCGFDDAFPGFVVPAEVVE